ncbi:hypothetical protein A6B35_29525 (plasmid) [Mesorhizobium amorphae CCNWGS0123]|nr:hypothetical protein A6B35_29525 [Mesorhizobium amorphae CCNWGS0123]
MFQPQFPKVAAGRTAEIIAEQTFNLASRQPCSRCEVSHGKRGGQVSLHQLDEFHDSGIESAMLTQQRQPLTFIASSDTPSYGKLPNIDCDRLTAMPFYKLHQHIEGGRAAGTGPDIVVDLIDRRRRLDAHEALLEGRQCLPMDGALSVIEQTRFRQSSDTTPECARVDAALPAFAQPCAQHLGFTTIIRLIAADKSQCGSFRLVQISAFLGQVAVNRDNNTATGPHGFAQVGNRTPAKRYPSGRLVGEAKDVQGGRQSEEFEPVRHVKGDGNRLIGGDGSPSVAGPVVDHVRLSAVFSQRHGITGPRPI